jgi:enoyl-CoA hydratase/carnithine racemase
MASNTPAEEVVSERRGPIEIWRLSQPDRMNALSRGMVAQLDAIVARAAADPELRAVIVTGEGARAFCAGADLRERTAMNDNDVRAFLSELSGLFERIDAFPRPVIAAINGLALGGGLELALACDLRVMASDAELGLPETTIGVIPGAGGTQRLPRAIGEARAKEMILLGRRMRAAEALACGLVQRSADDALRAALELAAELAGGAAIALSAALEAIERGRDLPLADALAVERRCYERTLVSEDRREALAAFADKRKPRFQGR